MVDEDWAVYREGREQSLYCRTADDDEYRNVVWPGVCAFPDFTSARTRAWWASHHRELLDAGVAGVWCDMNEPALMIPRQSTMPEDVVHPGDGEPKHHADVHNLYGSLMAQAARDGVLEARPAQRPFVITRAGYAGIQRHAMHWTGDNSSWWEHVWMSMPQLQNLGLSGVAWVGVDVGGFFDDCNGELLARFTEFGAFQPFCRNHSAMGTARQEPWAFGEPYTTVCREMLDLRMRLLPCLPAVRGEPSHRRADPPPAALRAPRRPGRLRGRRRVPARACPARGADHAARDRAPPRLRAGGYVGALVDGRAHRRPGARARARAARPAGGVRARHRTGADVAGDGARRRG